MLAAQMTQPRRQLAARVPAVPEPPHAYFLPSGLPNEHRCVPVGSSEIRPIRPEAKVHKVRGVAASTVTRLDFQDLSSPEGPAVPFRVMNVAPDLLSELTGEVTPVVGATGDYDALLELVGDRRFVLIGEASHGTHEFYRERARITRRLIDEMRLHRRRGRGGLARRVPRQPLRHGALERPRRRHRLVGLPPLPGVDVAQS